MNLEKGGSLATNLNNLYVLCTARLLQANLKMNVESLDSVVQILSGLRSAYAQIVDTPEAKSAAAQIQGRLQPAGSTTRTAQPLMPSSQKAAAPRAHVNAAYGRNAMRPAAPQEPMPPRADGEEEQPAQQRAHVQQFAAASGSVNRRLGAYAR